MARTFKESDFAPQSTRTFNESNFAQKEQRQAEDTAEALLTNLPTSGIGQDIVRGLPAAGGGYLGAGAGAALGTAIMPGPGTVAGGIIGAGIGAFGGEGIRQGLSQATAAAFPKEYPMLTPGQSVGQMGIQGALGALGETASLGLAALKPVAQRTGAQLMRVMTGVPEREGLAVLRDPSILSRALPVSESGAKYAEATGGIEGGVSSARKTLGKSYFSGEAMADKFDELLPAIKDESIDTETLLALRQRMMKTINDLPYKQGELRGLLSENIDTVDSLLEKRLPEWPGAKTGYRESKIAEEFSSWLPLNKNLSPNVLRTTAAVASAVKGAAEGHLWPSLALPAISPKVWGLGIRASGAIPSGTSYLSGKTLSGMAGSIAQEYMKGR